MIEHLNSVIQKIRKILDSHDLTNTEALNDVCREYSACCVEFNEQTTKLAESIDALSPDVLNTKLEELRSCQALFAFIDQDLFINIYKIYQWQLPPNLFFDVLNSIAAKIEKINIIHPYLERYRIAVLSKDPISAVHILRQMIKIEPLNKEWLKSLKTQEEQYFQTLTARAKEAIISKNKLVLSEILEELCGSSWVISLDQRVINKIRATIDQLNYQDVEKESMVIFDNIMTAYNTSNVDALFIALKQWHVFCEQNNFAADLASQTQIDLATKFLSDSLAQQKKEKEHEELLKLLKNAIDDGEKLSYIKPIYNEIKKYNFSIPDNLEAQYQNYLCKQAIIIKRRRIVLFCSMAFLLLIIIVCSYYAITTWQENYLAQRWQRQLKQAIQAPSPQDAFLLAEQLKKENPNLLLHQKLAILIKDIETLRKQYDAKADRFETLYLLVLNKLNSLEDNKEQVDTWLIELKTLADTKDFQKRYNTLYSFYNEKYQQIEQNADKLYLSALSYADELNSNIYDALASENFDRCMALINEYKKRISDANKIKNISSNASIEGQKLLNKINSTENVCTMRQQYRNECYIFIKQLLDSNDLADLEKKIDSFIARFPDTIYINVWEIIKNQDIAQAKTIQSFHFAYDTTDSKSLIMLPTAIAIDFAKHENNKKMSKLLCNNVITNLKTMRKNEDLHAVIFRKKNVLYDYYFRNYAKDIDISNRFKLNCIINDNGATAQFLLTWNPITKMAMLEDSRNANKIQSVEILYPQSLGNWPLAPHIVAMDDLLKKLENNSSTEYTIISSMNEVAQSKIINPSLKLAYFEALLDCFPVSYPDVYGGRTKLKTEIAQIKSEIPSNYNWWSSYSKPEIQQKLDHQIADLPISRYGDLLRIQDEMLNFSLARHLTPVGVLAIDSDGKYEFKKFATTPSNAVAELWVYNNSSNEFWIIGQADNFNANIDLSDFFIKSEKPLQIVYSPSDKLSTLNKQQELEAKAEKLGISALNWPATWPKIME